jgi:probable F420-dependent oxidoreductase
MMETLKQPPAGTLQIGVVYPQIELRGDPGAVRGIGTGAEELGFDHILAYDHVLGAVHAGRTPPLTGPYTEHDPFHDPFVMFAHLAGITERIRFVTGVLVLPQRQTALVARQAADVDLLSGGRLRLGVGIGYNPVEYHALGQRWATRGHRLDEQIPYLRQLWSGEPVTFTGDFDQIDRAALCPPPAGPIPIWLGGSSEVAYRRAAKLGDGFIFGYGMRRQAIESWRRVQELLRENERNVAGFRALFNLLPDHHGSWLAEEVAALPRLRDAGVTDVAVTSARNGLTTLDQHLDFITEVKARADRVLG